MTIFSPESQRRCYKNHVESILLSDKRVNRSWGVKRKKGGVWLQVGLRLGVDKGIRGVGSELPREVNHIVDRKPHGNLTCFVFATFC